MQTKPQQPHHAMDAPHTTAHPLNQKKKKDLTLSDWLEVMEHVDSHPYLCQKDIVDYFAKHSSGVLTFTQSALSKKLKKHDELEQWAKSNPNALLEKQCHVVIQPDFEEALYIWQQNSGREIQ
ncbi:hypothetical protein BT96DRAFT_947815 [Gymnopus androsaceus JB14]|uniref:Uncharacterized protein n=1 Tax=Gymnopus androsaceus JB14 TaxID=1447944 RepID=A0A6A4GR78_9AGAR|nr:hypothetical protein BT96DRAFT_947815 [Gymnopus androsaceus JB14]